MVSAHSTQAPWDVKRGVPTEAAYEAVRAQRRRTLPFEDSLLCLLAPSPQRGLSLDTAEVARIRSAVRRSLKQQKLSARAHASASCTRLSKGPPSSERQSDASAKADSSRPSLSARSPERTPSQGHLWSCLNVQETRKALEAEFVRMRSLAVIHEPGSSESHASHMDESTTRTSPNSRWSEWAGSVMPASPSMGAAPPNALVSECRISWKALAYVEQQGRVDIVSLYFDSYIG